MTSEQSLKHLCDKLLSCTFDRLPKILQAAHLSRPLFMGPVEPVGDGFRLAQPGNFLSPAPEALMPKLGIKSWRDGGALRVIQQGAPMLAVVEFLLLNPTTPQKITGRAWTRTGTPLNIYLFPYVDFADISETRFLAHKGGCRQISACLRGESAQLVESHSGQLMEAVREFARHMGEGAWVFELALLPDSRIRLVEVNPGLTPREVAALSE